MAAPSPFTVHRGARDLVLVAFPPSWLGIEAEDRDGNRATAENPETGRELLTRLPRAVALIDGPMFDPEDTSDYTRYQRARLLYRYLDRRRGITVPTRYPERGATLSVDPQGRVTVLDGAREAEGAVFAVQGYPEVVRNGRVEASERADSNATGRAALCALSDGRVAFAIARCGMAEFGRALLALRLDGGATVRDAIYTDGGGSTTLALRGEGGALAVAHGLDARRLPAYLIAEPPASGPGMILAPGSTLAQRLKGSTWLRVVGSALAVSVVGAGVVWWLDSDESAPPELR